MSQPDFDIAVIGGGPAGTAAAITATRLGARVVLFEAGAFPRQKVCGEFVSAEALQVLRDLLRFTPDANHVLHSAPAISQVRLLYAGRIVQAPVNPPGLSIPRYDLDSLLWRAAQHAGAKAHSNCEVRATAGNGPFLLDTSVGEVRARSVIVAAGRWSRFTQRVAVQQGPKWIGLKAHYKECHPPRSTDLYFFEHGYCGIQPVADNAVNACAMVRSDRAQSLEEVFALNPALAERRRRWQPMMDPVTTAPLLHLPPQPVRDSLIFVGDAAAFIDPFVGDGISIALRTGRLAANRLGVVAAGSGTLPSAVSGYKKNYQEEFVPLIAAASRMRALMSWPLLLQIAALEVLRLPGVLPYVIRKTRRAADSALTV